MRNIFQSPKRTLSFLFLIGATGYAALLAVPHILQITHDLQSGADVGMVILLSAVQVIAVAAVVLGGGSGVVYGSFLWAKHVHRNIIIAQSSPPMTEIEYALWSQRVKLLNKLFWISICILAFSLINTFLALWVIEIIHEQSSEHISIRVFDGMGDIFKLLLLHLAFLGFVAMDALSFFAAVIFGVVRGVQKAKGVRKDASDVISNK